MASILRQIVAGPRARHPEARLDLCYATDNIIVTSGPSSVWPKKAYRNPTDQLVAFLDKKHGEKWAIFEFRAEGTGYPDSEVYNRIHHFPWPDHHPPPFKIVPNLMAAMRNWLKEDKDRVAVVHCKAGKGRSGTATCSYLISEEGWKSEDALHRFTVRRMRAGFGNGVSIPSQLRWVQYVDRWTNEMQKKYVERPVEICEVHLWGLRDGVKVGLEGFMEDGRRIHTFHTFTRQEKIVVNGQSGTNDTPKASTARSKTSETLSSPVEMAPGSSTQKLEEAEEEAELQDVILKPKQPVQLPTSDMNVDFERRNKVRYTGYTMVTSIAHVWFNAWFEGGFEGASSGVFEIDWEAIDGLKGSARKGIKAFDKMKVVWQYAKQAEGREIVEPAEGEPVEEGIAVDYRGEDSSGEKEARRSDGVNSNRAGGAALTMGAMINQGAETLGKELGLRKSDPTSADISRSSSYVTTAGENPSNTVEYRTAVMEKAEEAESAGIKVQDPTVEKETTLDKKLEQEGIDGRADTTVGRGFEKGLEKASSVIKKVMSADKPKEGMHEKKSADLS